MGGTANVPMIAASSTTLGMIVFPSVMMTYVKPSWVDVDNGIERFTHPGGRRHPGKNGCAASSTPQGRAP